MEIAEAAVGRRGAGRSTEGRVNRLAEVGRRHLEGREVYGLVSKQAEHNGRVSRVKEGTRCVRQ